MDVESHMYIEIDLETDLHSEQQIRWRSYR